ncbi:MAG: hypothetical protein IPP43_11200 [Chitinophagaceae bacterium]|nr:hypothetical protein [Chitinophagaceae bacterium]MBL0131612.1 hypothetical protein [Chitinophagaceae bacterium]MBL0272411.1 hypothetical protein [Chitinophagaceae bacterium]
MKKQLFIIHLFVFTLLFVSVNVSAQNNTAEDTTAKLAITEAGKPAGNITEKKFSKDGGTLFSGDGSLELIIPSGALSKNTNISIQPITNTMPNGNGQAYRLEPSGIQFQKPVQLVFHYNPEESADSAQLLLGIAMQDISGQWYSLNKFTLDTVAKTIGGSINHFSDWSNFNAIKLYPSSARLKVRKQLTLSIDLVSSEDEELVPLNPTDDLSPLRRRRIPWTSTWRANEIINGNAVVGKIDVGSKTTVTYTAPASVPTRNPVAITAELKGLTYKYKGRVLRELRLVSNILIYDDAYEVKMISILEGDAGTVLGTVTYKDTGSFVVSLESGRARIIERVNRNIPDKLEYTGKCEVTLLKAGSGNINILGVNNIKVIPPASPGGISWIEIDFKYSPTIIPLLNFKCPPVGGRGPWYTNTNEMARTMVASIMRAFPHTVKFEAKVGKVVLIEVGGLSYFKMTVEQLPDDQ